MTKQLDSILDEILGNLTFIVGMAHVKAAQGEITGEEASKRTHQETAEAKADLEAYIAEQVVAELEGLQAKAVAFGWGGPVQVIKDRIQSIRAANKGGK